jgi:hypothetical protein
MLSVQSRLSAVGPSQIDSQQFILIKTNSFIDGIGSAVSATPVTDTDRHGGKDSK